MNHLPLSQAVEAVVNGQHVVTLDDAHPHGGSDGSVHPSAGGADVHDGHVDVALVRRLGSAINVKVLISGAKTASSYFNIWGIDVGQQLVRVPVVLKAPTSGNTLMFFFRHNNTLCYIRSPDLRIHSLSSELDSVFESALGHGSGHVFGL